MITTSLLTLLWVAQIGEPAARTDLSTLDEARLRKSLETTYGEFGSKRSSEWRVAIQGRTEVWTWDGTKFTCPQSEAPAETGIDCNQWVPASFRWFLSSNRWLEPWVSMKRKDFFLGTPELKTRAAGAQLGNALMATSEESPLDPEAGEEEAVEEPKWEGKRLASRVWTWVGRDGETVDVYISLRNSWIERLDPDDYSAEYLEWTKPNRYARPALTKLTMDRSGVRVSFQHIRDLKK